MALAAQKLTHIHVDIEVGHLGVGPYSTMRRAVIASAAGFTSTHNCDTPSVPDHIGRLNCRASAVQW